MSKVMDAQKFKDLVQETTFENGGLLSPEQGNAFIDLVVENNVVLQECTIMKMTRVEEEIHYLDMASRQLRKHEKNTRGTSGKVTSSGRTVKVTETKLWLELDVHAVRHALVGSDGKDLKGRVMKKITDMASKSVTKDIEALGVIGEIDGDSGHTDYDFFKIADGWLNIVQDEGHFATLDSIVPKIADLSKANLQAFVPGDLVLKNTVFPALLSALPVRWRRDKKVLRIYCSVEVAQLYAYEIGQHPSATGLEYILGEKELYFQGIKLQPLVDMPDNSLILTPKGNLVAGFLYESIEKEFDKNIVENTIDAVWRMPLGYNIALPDAAACFRLEDNYVNL